MEYMENQTKHNTNTKEIQKVLTRGVAEVLPGVDTLAQLMQKKRIRVYLGIDPTGSLLTLGHSVVLRKLQQFADLGHEVILLIGNGTVRIGDPTGKDSTRPELTDEQITENFKNWKEQASKVLDFNKIEIRYNGDWLDKLSYKDMVQLMAKTTVQQLMERDMFQKRLEEGKPIHGHEIMYPLLQGYDSVVMDVDLEIGGTDQTFNMMMGRTLQKAYNEKEKWVLTTPIINGTDGRKMSKSYNNFIALTDSAQDMYGKLMSIADSLIVEYATVLTDMSEAEIKELQSQLSSGAVNPMKIKKKMAESITAQYHSNRDVTDAIKFFEQTVQNKEIPEDIPVVSVKGKKNLLTVLQAAMPEESNSNLRRLIEQGAVQNAETNEKFTDVYMELPSTVSTLKVGKRRFFQLK